MQTFANVLIWAATSVTLLSLDAPRAPLPDWSLVVSVGDAHYAIPRTALKVLVAGHPEWRTE